MKKLLVAGFIVGTIFTGTAPGGPGRWLDGRGLGLGVFGVLM